MVTMKMRVSGWRAGLLVLTAVSLSACETQPSKPAEQGAQIIIDTKTRNLNPPQLVRDGIVRLRDPDPVERALAAHQLGKLGPGATDAIKPLLQLLADDASVLLSSYLGGGYRSSDATSPGEEAAQALVKIGHTAVEYLIPSVKDPNPTVRRLATKALGQLGELASIPVLLLLLDDTDREVRAAAAIGLGSYRHPLAAQTILDALAKAKPSARADMVYALAQINDVIVVPALLTRAASEAVEVRAAIMYALGRLRDARGMDVLLQGLQDEDELVRANAAFALHAYFSPRTIEALLGALEDKSERVRAAAQEALQLTSGTQQAQDRQAWRAWWVRQQLKMTTPSGPETPTP
jgi:HEAT repeat protein